MVTLAQNLVILSLAGHLSHPRSILHMYEPQFSTSRVETQENPWKIKNIGSIDSLVESPSKSMESPINLNPSQNL
jgi:hypothetical protein